jgi:predicted pyridoxine 5'-phosphate oxidase superfamily flavin-nucleotide-binding protein
MIPLAGRALGTGLAYDNPSHGAAAVSDPLAESRPAERLSVEPIVWLTTAGADGQPQSSPVWFHWDGSAFWLRTQVAARKVANIRANPKVAAPRRHRQHVPLRFPGPPCGGSGEIRP